MSAEFMRRVRARLEQVQALKAEVERKEGHDKAKAAQTTEQPKGSQTKAGLIRSGSIFISGLSGWPSEAALRQSLEQFGKLAELTFPCSRDKPRGFAYAKFEDPDAAKTVIEQGSCEVEGFTVRVEPLELSPVQTNEKQYQYEAVGWGAALFRAAMRCHINEYRRPATGHNMDYDDDCESSDNASWFS